MNTLEQEIPVVATAPTRRKTAGHCAKTKRILLVDDDASIRRMLFRVLAAENFEVQTAANGAEALEIAGAVHPDLVLLDLNLPVKNGWDTFEKLSTENPLLPIIIITARPNQLFPALASGVGALMEKPLDLPQLLQTMRDLLAEPAQARLARMAGHATEFRYLPPKRS